MAIAVELSKISGVRINGEFYPFTFYTPSVIPGVKGYTVTGPMSSITAIHTSKK